MADGILRSKDHTVTSEGVTLPLQPGCRLGSSSSTLLVTKPPLGFVTGTYQGDPAAAAAVGPAEVEAQEGDGHDEAEHGDKHHPALQHGD